MKNSLIALLVLLLSGCANGPYINNNYSARAQDSQVQFLILHYTAQDFEESLRILTTEQVSSHYLVRDNPAMIYRLVPESRRSFHAGESSWQGYTQLNASSIGIEIVNLGNVSQDYCDYPPAQIDVVVQLVKKIVAKHKIRPDRILGHSDIAPQRKVDPGPKFPWKRLADEGLIIWPDEAKIAERLPSYQRQLPSVRWFQKKLAKHGFVVPQNGQLDEPTRLVIAAFQMKYRPARYDGEPDAETAAILDVITAFPTTRPRPPF